MASTKTPQTRMQAGTRTASSYEDAPSAPMEQALPECAIKVAPSNAMGAIHSLEALRNMARNVAGACWSLEKLQSDQKSPSRTKLTKTDTAALWHAVNWMDVVLGEWKRDGFKNDQDQAQHEVQRQHLAAAKQALRKVNKIRRERNDD